MFSISDLLSRGRVTEIQGGGKPGGAAPLVVARRRIFLSNFLRSIILATNALIVVAAASGCSFLLSPNQESALRGSSERLPLLSDEELAELIQLEPIEDADRVEFEYSASQGS